MEPIVIALIATALSSLGAFVAGTLIGRAVRKEFREFVLRDGEGRKRTIEIPSDASPHRIAEMVTEEVELEERVRAILDAHLESLGGSRLRHGKDFDFLLSVRGVPVAIEVKRSLAGLTAHSLRHFVDKSEGIDKIFFLTTGHVPEAISKASQDLVRAGKLSFVSLGPIDAPDLQMAQIRTALEATRRAS